MQETVTEIRHLIGVYVPNLIAALVILILGWLVAVILASIVRKALRRTELANRLGRWLSEEEQTQPVDVAYGVGKGVFYLTMLFVLVAFFQTLQLTRITEPLNQLLNLVFQFGPRVLGAGLLLLLAWLVATGLHFALSRALRAARLDERFSDQAGLEEEQRPPLATSLANMVYWLVFLFFLPAVLHALALEGLLDPVNALVNQVLAFLPNIFSAGLIVALGWFLARIVQRVVTNLLEAAGADQLSERVGLAPALGAQRLSRLLGLVVYILILIPVVIAAFNALALEAITQPASNMLNMVLTAVPTIFAAALVVAIAYVVGRMAAGLVTRLLAGIGFNTIPERLGLRVETSEEGNTPADVAGTLVLVAIIVFAITAALNLLGFEALGALVSEFLVFAGHVLLGVVIFALGLYLANLAARAIQASGVTQDNLLALAARVSILTLAGAMALRQIGVANEIITLAFGLLLGAVAVAVAIAFGVGGREIAARELEEWVDSLKSKQS
jgi:hypothetical protein